MRYKTSCFNPTLSKHDLKRFWPLPVLVFLFLTLVMVPNYYNSMIDFGHTFTLNPYTPQAGTVLADTAESMQYNARTSIYGFGGLLVLTQFFTAIISALLVMQHIHGRKQIQFYHGLPLKRRCSYITNVVTGYLMALVPALLSVLIIMIMAAVLGVEVFPAVQLMGITTASFTIFYAIAIVACTLAGQSFGALLLYGGMNCAAVAILAGGAGVARYILPGFNETVLLPDAANWLTPVMQLTRYTSPLYTEDGIGLPYGYNPWPFVIYGVAGILLLVLGGFLYQIRKGETAGEMIAFPFIRTLCKVLVALMAGLGGTVILVLSINPYDDISFPAIALMVVLLLIVGWIAAEMVIRKTFRVFQKTNLAQCLTLAVLTLLILAGGNLDVVGYVNRTPDLGQVSEAKLQMHGISVEVDPMDALEFHETVLRNMDELSNNTTYRDVNSISVYYYDEDGDVLLKRQYYILGGLEADIIQAFLTLMDTPEYNYRSWFPWQDTDITADDMSRSWLYGACRYYEVDGAEEDVPYLLLEGEKMITNAMELTEEEGYLIYEAVCRDIREGNMMNNFHSYFTSGQAEYGNIEFIYYDSPYGQQQEYDAWSNTCYSYITLYDTMTNTLEAFAELGVTVNPEALK